MCEEYNNTIGDLLFADIDDNEYLNEIYESILRNYTIKLFDIDTEFNDDIDIAAALRFADILSKSTSVQNSDKHKNWSQEIVALLNTLYPNNRNIQYYLGSVLNNTGNYYGVNTIAPEYKNVSFLDNAYEKFISEGMNIPAEPDKKFISTQKKIYEHLEDDYLSYSAPTSMGKSFIMRMFLKKQILDNKQKIFALLVPTKALINEVTSKIINDLKDELVEKNYRVVTSAGSIVLEQERNFIFVLTPERLLYLLISHKDIKIDYLFVDEAHKISSKDSRSVFYYKVIDILARRDKKPHIAFASPNIPNPEVYLKLIPDIENITKKKITTEFSPVSQIKFFADLQERVLRIYNTRTNNFRTIACLENLKLNELINCVSKNTSQNIVYCSSTKSAIENAVNFAKELAVIENKELLALYKDIKNEVHGDYYLAGLIIRGVAYHIGYLPATIRLRIEELYCKGLIKTIFCTSTLIEGVNLPADNLFVTNYKIGRSNLTPVDFNNLIGRVGRIDFGLFGNVILVRTPDEKDKVKENFEILLTTKVPDQKISVVSELTKVQKEHIVECLKVGDFSIIANKKNSEEHGNLMRKFALILLRDIEKDRDSVVRREFEPLMDNDDIKQIKNAFSNYVKQTDDDLNISVDQADNIFKAIKGGLTYPPVKLDGKIDFEVVVRFLERLCEVFKWDIYEYDMVGKKNIYGEHPKLRWYAVVLLQWIQGMGLSFIIKSAIDYKADNPKSSVKITHNEYEDYDGSRRHKNIVITETLQVIENILLFKISNYFLRLSTEYKKIHNVDSFANDWYEYLEYGTMNEITILLQRSGFSRETATYIRNHYDEYIIKTDSGIKIKNTILECGKESVCREVKDVQFNVPELFAEG